ncbi:MAG: ParB/RepB/Spo0J family partition protein [Clostridia bacterium]|nr:ParB/RepB/Spo0J family partition protein [Clostridia bacterium]
MHTFADKKLLMLKPDDIIPNENQPRKVFDTYELQSLADSIAANGIIQPLTVRKIDGGKYSLIAGERRLRAAKMAGLRRIPCVLHRTSDLVASLYAITENMQRSDLNCFEEALAIQTLINDFRLTQAEVAVQLGMANSTVSNKLRLLKLSSEIQKRILSANLTERHARALLRLSPEQRNDALDKIIAEGLNLSQTEELIENILNPVADETPEEPTVKPIRKAVIGDIKLFSNSLSKLLCTMQNAGITANSRKHETEKYIEYKVRIFKNQPEYDQLKIC